MKKKLMSDYRVISSENFDDIKKEFPYPFDRDLLNLLKKENKFQQTYYYVEKGNDYAFFVVYKNKMNIFTYAKLNLYLNINVVGFPCSLSNCGYVTNNEAMMLEFIKSIKGAKLILNVDRTLELQGFTVGETLPTCMFHNRYTDTKAYLDSMRSSYRRRINIAKRKCKDIEVKEIKDNNPDIYDLYLNTYNKSDYKLEKLERGFFRDVDAVKIGFLRDDKPIGFVLLKKVEDRLIFMLCGMDYSSETTDLYYYMLYKIVEYAINNKCKTIDFGQTSEETKMKFGAVLQKKYFYAHHSNAVINWVVGTLKGVLEYKYQFPKYRVFKEEE